MKNFKIDWPNHLIGFFSALFGILIAFELEEWREHRNNQRDAQEAFAKLKNEILINKNSLHEAVKLNQRMVSLLHHEVLPYLNDDLVFIGSYREARELNEKWAPIATLAIEDSLARKVIAPVRIFMNQLIFPTLHHAAWESAKETGVMNAMEYDKVLTISYVYNLPKIADELGEIRRLLRLSDEVKTKTSFQKLLRELQQSHLVLERELENFDAFANMVEGIE